MNNSQAGLEISALTHHHELKRLQVRAVALELGAGAAPLGFVGS